MGVPLRLPLMLPLNELLVLPWIPLSELLVLPWIPLSAPLNEPFSALIDPLNELLVLPWIPLSALLRLPLIDPLSVPLYEPLFVPLMVEFEVARSWLTPRAALSESPEGAPMHAAMPMTRRVESNRHG